MANIRNIRKRLRAVHNIRTITNTLATISASRLQRATKQLRAAQPAIAAGEDILRTMLASTAGEHPLMSPGRGKVHLVVALTSDRGMCGSYNRQAIEAAFAACGQAPGPGELVRLYVIGNRGIARMRSVLEGRGVVDGLVQDQLASPHRSASAPDERRLAEEVGFLGGQFSKEFLAGDLATVRVAAMKLLGGTRAKPAVTQILPLTVPAGPDLPPPCRYDFYPDPAEVLDSLLPLLIRLRLMGVFAEAAVAEHTVRLTAMRSAAGNADDMINTLTRQMNRARQSVITSELAEIVGAADAVKGTS